MRQLKTACIVLAVMSLLLGIIYPLAVTGIAQLLFPFRANGSLIVRENGDRPAPAGTGDTSATRSSRRSVDVSPIGPVTVFPTSSRLLYVGSALIGQSFTNPRYFHGRPSDCGYDGANSYSSNLGPSNPALLDSVRARVERLARDMTQSSSIGIVSQATSADLVPSHPQVPADLVLSSASGLDPDVTPASALLQVGRVARERNLDPELVRGLVLRSVGSSFLGIFGQPRVNVLRLNLALDSMSSGK